MNEQNQEQARAREDAAAFNHHVHILRLALYVLAAWLDQHGYTDSVIQCEAVLDKIDVVATTFAAEGQGKKEARDES